MIISAFKLYLRVAWALKTPFVFLMDTKYRLLSALDARDVYHKKLQHIKYSAFHDCNAFAWLAKALAYKERINSFGFVIGLARGLHAWNCIATLQGVFQLEPQTERMFERDRKYWALLVII